MHEKEKKAEAAADGGKGTTESKRTRLATRHGTMPFPPAGTAPHNRTRAEFGAGWKCLWRFDVAHCAVLFLPAGEPLGNASAIALRWAAHFWAHSLNRSSAATFAAFNPSAVDDTNLLIRIALVSSSYLSVPPLNVGSGRVLIAATNHFLWLRRHDAGDASLSLERALPGEDARGVWVDACLTPFRCTIVGQPLCNVCVAYNVACAENGGLDNVTNATYDERDSISVNLVPGLITDAFMLNNDRGLVEARLHGRLGEAGRLRSGGVRRGGLPPLARSCVV